jgi:hypothetical protein
MCLSYHMRNTCSASCPWAKDHRTHTQVEDETPLKWAKAAFLAIA